MGVIAGSKRKLKKSYTRKGYTATYIKNAGDVHLYERGYEGGNPHWEVVIAKKNYSSKVSEPFVYPSDADWGYMGWTLTTRERAEEKFNEIKNQ